MANFQVAILFIFVCTMTINCQELSQLSIVTHGVQFLESNGHKNISIFSLNRMLKLPLNVTKKLYSKRALTVINAHPNEAQNKDTYLLIESADEIAISNKASEYVSFIHRSGGKCLMVVLPPFKDPDTKNYIMDGFKAAAHKLNENLVFYFGDGDNWFEIMNVKNTEQSIATKLKVNYKMQILQSGWDLQGIVITDSSTDYMPFSGAIGCDQNGTNCKEVTGIVPSIFKVVASRINMTLRHVYNPTGNWGMSPNSGGT